MDTRTAHPVPRTAWKSSRQQRAEAQALAPGIMAWSRVCRLWARVCCCIAILAVSAPANAIWVVNFGTASTLKPGAIGFAAGVGGQMVFVGEPRKTNGFFTIPHAGLRYGLAPRLDGGLRLAPVPLPFSTVGPGFGVNADLKYQLSAPAARLRFAAIGGLGGAHVLVQNENRFAWSPNAAMLATRTLSANDQITVMGRYVYLAIPTAKEGGASGNNVHIAGISAGLKHNLTPAVSILPEVGVYWYEGRLNRARTSGPGFQYGVMLATLF